MSLIIPQQPDCISTWREAVRAVDAEPRHEAHNVLLTIEDPALARKSATHALHPWMTFSSVMTSR